MAVFVTSVASTGLIGLGTSVTATNEREKAVSCDTSSLISAIQNERL
jgi:hypothetical protein